VLFVLDDAKQLNEQSKTQDRFHIGRRTMRVLPPNNGTLNMFFAVIDTTSKLTEIARPPTTHNSLRTNQAGFQLFSPVTVMKMLEVW
jgi:hypothetical protein